MRKNAHSLRGAKQSVRSLCTGQGNHDVPWGIPQAFLQRKFSRLKAAILYPSPLPSLSYFFSIPFSFFFPTRSLLESKDIKILGNRENMFGSKICSELSLTAIYAKHGQIPQTLAISFKLI